MQQEKLNEIKNEVQKILDRHLEPEQRFSVQDLDEESVFLLINLLLEKDDLERERIWAAIEERTLIKQIDLRINVESIKEIKDKLDYQKISNRDVNELQEIINTEKDLDEKLDEIFN